MRPVIIVFAKAPVAGRVKTRLVPPLSEAGAARLHAAFVRDTLETALLLNADVELHTDILTDAWAGFGVPHRLQCEGDLGLRMFQALAAAGREQAMIVGSDAPDLPCEHLRALLAAQADVALGPAEDGGYYAIGCRRVHPRMFDRVPWSSSETLARTIESARAAGLTVALGERWRDVDTPDDLKRLRAGGRLPRHTVEALRREGLL